MNTDNRETLKALVELAKKAIPLDPRGIHYNTESQHLTSRSELTALMELKHAIPALEALLNQEPVAYAVTIDGRFGKDFFWVAADDGKSHADRFSSHDSPMGFKYVTVPLYSSPPATVPVSELEALESKWRKELRDVDSDRDNYSAPSAAYFADDLRSLINRSHK